MRGFDFEALEDEDTFAMNYINLVYPWTSWRPKYYLSLEYRRNDLLWDTHLRINASVAEHCWLDARFEHDMYGLPGIGYLNNVTWVNRCIHHQQDRGNRTKWPKEWHLPGLCTAFTGMSPMMQIANELGYDEIYLLGCDLGHGNSVLETHIAPSYLWPYVLPDDIENLDVERDLLDDSMLHVHKIAHKSSKAKIYNATVGGNLEVYERVNFEEIIRNS